MLLKKARIPDISREHEDKEGKDFGHFSVTKYALKIGVA